MNILIGTLALLLGVLALLASDALGLDDYVAPWFADLIGLTVMFVLIAALGASSKVRRPHAP